MDDSNGKSSPSVSNYGASTPHSSRTVSLNLINNNSYDLNEAKIMDENKENSYYDKDLNEKIIKLLIGDHPLLPMKTIEKIAHCNFMNQHYKSKDFYNIRVIDEIIHNESSHIVAEFKDYLIKGDISEFLQQYYKKKESSNLLPKIYEYYISCSVIFPNYVILPESQYIYKNIQRKQRVIDIQQEQEDKEENIKNGLIELEKEPTVFNTQAFDSILNQTDTSGVKQYFGVVPDMGDNEDMLKLVNHIETAEKKVKGKNSNSKNKKGNICKLKKDNNNMINNYMSSQYQNTIFINEGGYSQKMRNVLHPKNSDNLNNKKNNINNNISGNINNITNNQNKPKNTLKQILKQSTENNVVQRRKKSNFSTQITYMDSSNNYINNAFDLKGIESIKKVKYYQKGSNDKYGDEKDPNKKLFKNSSQTMNNFKSINSNDKGFDLYHKNKINKDSPDCSIINKESKNDKNDARNKDHTSRNSNVGSNMDLNAKITYKNATQGKNIIVSYKTKSQNKNKIKGYQTSRNKYENNNIYINISKSNLSKNHQSLDNDINDLYKRQNINNKGQNKHRSLKNNLINALLNSGSHDQKKKAKKYNNGYLPDNNSYNDSFIDSIQGDNNLKEYDDNNRNNDDINTNISILNNNDIIQNYNENKITNIFLYNNSNTQNKPLNSSNLFNEQNNINNNEYNSVTKTVSINSYISKQKNSGSNLNTINQKRPNSMSKIPMSLPENKMKKSNKKLDDIDSQNKLKEYIDNYLDDYFCSKVNNNDFMTQYKNYNQDENNYNINSNRFNDNLNNYHQESKSKSLKKNKNEQKNGNGKKDREENIKLRNSIFNFEKRRSQKMSQKNFYDYDKFKSKNSPKNISTKRTSSIKTSVSGNKRGKDRGPLSARDPNSKYQINAEIIELLNNKIQKIKQSIKEPSNKCSNSISSVFKKKKIPLSNRKAIGVIIKKSEDFLEQKSQNTLKTRNKNNTNGLLGVTNSNSNLGISSNLVNTIVNSIYQTNLLSPNKKNLEYEKLMKTFQKFQKSLGSFNSNYKIKKRNQNILNNKNNNLIYGNKDSLSKKKKSKNCTNNNNYDNNFNIEVNIKNNIRGQPKKTSNYNKNQNDNLNSLNINFNNFTNNFNYNYNINPVNNVNTIGSTGNNNNLNSNNNYTNNNYSTSIISKGKSSSQKTIVGKTLKNQTNFKGIPINGFDKLINKKYNTRNYNIPMSATDRIKGPSMYSTSININSISNRYKNTTNRKMSNNKVYYKRK